MLTQFVCLHPKNAHLGGLCIPCQRTGFTSYFGSIDRKSIEGRKAEGFQPRDRRVPRNSLYSAVIQQVYFSVCNEVQEDRKNICRDMSRYVEIYRQEEGHLEAFSAQWRYRGLLMCSIPSPGERGSRKSAMLTTTLRVPSSTRRPMQPGQLDSDWWKTPPRSSSASLCFVDVVIRRRQNWKPSNQTEARIIIRSTTASPRGLLIVSP